MSGIRLSTLLSRGGNEAFRQGCRLSRRSSMRRASASADPTPNYVENMQRRPSLQQKGKTTCTRRRPSLRRASTVDGTFRRGQNINRRTTLRTSVETVPQPEEHLPRIASLRRASVSRSFGQTGQVLRRASLRTSMKETVKHGWRIPLRTPLRASLTSLNDSKSKHGVVEDNLKSVSHVLTLLRQKSSKRLLSGLQSWRISKY